MDQPSHRNEEILIFMPNYEKRDKLWYSSTNSLAILTFPAIKEFAK